MKSTKIIILIAVALLFSSAVFAKNHTPEERGKALFNDKKLGGGTSGKSCGTCHPRGKNLEGVGSQTDWLTPAGGAKTLEDAINLCITIALRGKALDAQSAQMKDLVSYMKTIKAKPAKTPKAGAPKTPPTGC